MVTKRNPVCTYRNRYWKNSTCLYIIYSLVIYFFRTSLSKTAKTILDLKILNFRHDTVTRPKSITTLLKAHNSAVKHMVCTTENSRDWGGCDESSRAPSKSLAVARTRRQRVQAAWRPNLRPRRPLFTPSRARHRRHHRRTRSTPAAAPAARRRGRQSPLILSSASTAQWRLHRNEYIDDEARYDWVQCRCRQPTLAKSVSVRVWDSHRRTEPLQRLRALTVLAGYQMWHLVFKKHRHINL